MGYSDNFNKWGNSDNLNSFANPFATFANRIYPRTIYDVFKWAEWLWLRHGTYSQAIKKSVRYFINGIELFGEGVGKDVRKKYEEFLIDKFDLLNVIAATGDDYIYSGNSFSSVHIPFIRQLVCPLCGLTRPLNKTKPDKDWNFRNYEFVGKCPACDKDVTFTRVDTKKPKDAAPITILRWAPQHMSIDYCTITGDCEYYYEIPVSDKEKINKGDPLYLESVPWEFVEACKTDRPLKMNKSTFFHARCMTSASLEPKLKGWGLPLFMSNFSQVVMLQILERYNEAIAMDYIVPFRLLSPPAAIGGGDPMLVHNVGNFLSSIRQMIKEHQLDPTTWHTVPYPVQYQALGGNASSVVPVDLLNYVLDQLLTSMGIPQEFYRTTLVVQGIPIGLRMFEKTWSHHVSVLNKWLNWFLDQCSKFLVWEKVHGRLIPTSVVEDDMIKQIKLNLASANVISKQTALQAIGLDLEAEQARLIEEEFAMQEKLREQQAKDEKTQMLMETFKQGMIPPQAYNASNGLGFMPQYQQQIQGAGAMPPAPPIDYTGLGQNPSIEDLLGQAQDLAGQLMTADPTTRRRELTNLKKQNPVLHAQVKQMLENQEQQAAQTGIQLARSGQL